MRSAWQDVRAFRLVRGNPGSSVPSSTTLQKSGASPIKACGKSRGEPRHYVYSKVMCWVGVDRFIRHVGSSLEATSLGIYQTLRRSIHEEICKQGYHGGLGSFVDYFGAQSVDASLLMLPLVGFLPIDDERIASTISRIERELMPGGLVRRYRTNEIRPKGRFCPAASGSSIAGACKVAATMRRVCWSACWRFRMISGFFQRNTT